MFTNADVTLYLYHKCGKDMRYIRIPVEDVYWEDVRQSTFLKMDYQKSHTSGSKCPHQSPGTF